MKNIAIRGTHFCQRQGTLPHARAVVFLRHGQSIWNKQKRFSGWSDIPLTETGIRQSRKAGKILKEEGFQFDICFTSYLSRAIQTFNYAAEELDALHIPLVKSWKLNERHYGALQGLSKVQTVQKHGKEMVQKWRRHFDFPPPTLDEADQRHPGNQHKYKKVARWQLPTGQSLKQTIQRVIPYWQESIVPEIEKGQKVLVVAHENSLRGIIKILDGICDEQVAQLQIPTGIPLVYQFNLQMQKLSHYYLASQAELKQQMSKVQQQVQK